MTAILKEKPDKIVDFMLKWCETEGRKLEGGNDEKYDNSHLPPSEDSFIIQDEEEDDDKVIEQIKQKQRKTKKKFGISAEAYGEYNKLGDFKPRVIPKTDEQKNMIRQILEKNFMFKNLESKNQEIVINAMEIKEYKNQDVVIKQNDDGNEVFIVSKGKLKCEKVFKEREEPKFLKEYVSGEVFGELALMYNAPRAATIIAVEDSQLFSLDRDTFNHIVKKATIDKRNHFHEFLNKIEILEPLDDYEREKICDCL